MSDSPLTLLYPGAYCNLSANDQYFHVTSKCCSSVVVVARPDLRSNLWRCSACGASFRSSSEMDESAYPVAFEMGGSTFPVSLARANTRIFDLWISSWFPDIEVSFND